MAVYNFEDLNFLPMDVELSAKEPKEENHTIPIKEIAKGYSDVVSSTINTIPNIMSEQRQNNINYMKDVFGAIQLMESYGMITINRPQTVQVVENDHDKAAKAFLIGLGIFIGLLIIF